MPKLSKVHLTNEIVEAAQPGQCISDATVRGLRLMVTPKGTRRYVAAFRAGPERKPTMKVLGSYPNLSVTRARKLAADVLWQVRSTGLNPADEAKAARKAAEAVRNAPEVVDLAKLYLEDYAPSQALRPATVRHARALFAKVPPELNSRKVAEVTTTDIRKLRGDVRAAGIASGSKGVYQANRLLAVLSKAFELAIERGWRTDPTVPANPCKRIPKYPEDKRWRNLSQQEVSRLLAACNAYESGLRPMSVSARKKHSPPLPFLPTWKPCDREAVNAVRLLLFTGARLQEVLRAEWSQFDLERGIWEKPSAQTKTHRMHRLELEGPALELLKLMAERKGHPVYLFPGNPNLRHAKAPIDIRTGEPKGITPRTDLKYPWRAISAMAELEGVRLHDLRRTLASVMLSSGASLATVGKTLGHTQPNTTAGYATLAPSVQRTALGQAGRSMVRGMTPTHSETVVPFTEPLKALGQ